jgi:WS/DGAT/MGAT family acyltransferase
MDRPTNPMVVTGVFVFDRPLALEPLRALVQQRFLAHARLRQRVVEPSLPVGRPQWEDDPNFDLRAHVHRLALPAPGDDAALRELIGDLLSTRLDLSRPPWQVYLLEGYGDGCAVVTRMHHCLGDGASMMRLLLSIIDEDSASLYCQNGNGPAHAAEGNGLAANGALGNALHAAEDALRGSLDVLLHPSRLVDMARTALGGAMSLGRLLALPADPQTPFKGRLGVIKRAAWSEPLPLERVKQLAHALGGTINDVLLAAMTGALRGYLLGRVSKVDESIRAIVPVNLRGAAAVPEFGNQFGLVFLSLPIEVDGTRQRYDELKRRMDALKATPESYVAFFILEALGASAPAIEGLGVEVFSSKGTLVMTNVPGPRERISMAGLPVRSMMFWVPQSGDVGMGISILSYAGEVRLGVSTDALLVPDPESIVEQFTAEYAALSALARPEPKRSAKRPARAGTRRAGAAAH